MSPHSVASQASATLQLLLSQQPKQHRATTTASHSTGAPSRRANLVALHSDSLSSSASPHEHQPSFSLGDINTTTGCTNTNTVSSHTPSFLESLKWPASSTHHDAPREPMTAHSSATLVGTTSPDLESHFVALGHSIFLREQRDSLQASLTESQADRTRLQRLSFRLAARIASRDAASSRRLSAQTLQHEQHTANVVQNLQRTIHKYEAQSHKLLTSLQHSAAAESAMPAQLHASLRASSPDSDCLYAPSEILEICQHRVDALLRECRLSKDTLVLLRQTEQTLRQDAASQECVIESLRQQQVKSSARLQTLKGQLSAVVTQLADSQKEVLRYSRERDALRDSLSISANAKQQLEDEQRSMAQIININEKDLERIKTELHMATIKNDMLSRSKASLEEIVQSLKSKCSNNSAQLSQTNYQLAGARKQLDDLELQQSQQIAVINMLQNDLGERQNQIDSHCSALDDLQHEAEERASIHRAEQAKAEEAQSLLSKELTQVLAEQETLQSSESDLRQAFEQQKQQVATMEASHRQAVDSLSEIRATHQHFVQSSEALTRELEGEKAKTVALIQTEARLRAQIADHELVVSRIKSHVAELEAKLADELAKSSATASEARQADEQLKTARTVLAEVNAAHESVIAEFCRTQSDLQAALDTARSQISSLQASLQQSEQLATSLKAENRDLIEMAQVARSAAAVQHEAACLLHESYQAKLDEKDAQLSVARLDNDRKIAEMEQGHGQRANEYDSLMSQHRAILADKADLETQVRDLRGQLARRQAIKKDLDLALTTQRTRAQHLASLRKDLQLKLRLTENNAIHLDEQVISLSINLESMQEKVRVTEDNSKLLTSQIESLQQIVVDLEQSCADKEGKLRILGHESQMRGDELDRIKFTLIERDDEMNTARSDLRIHKSKCQQLEIALTEQKSQSSSLRSQLASQTQQSIELNVQLRSLRRSGAAQVSRLSELENQNQKLERQVTELTSDALQLKTQNTGLIARTAELEAKVSSRDRANSMFHQQFRTLQKRVTESDRRVLHLERMLAHREAEIERLQRARRRSMQDITQIAPIPGDDEMHGIPRYNSRSQPSTPLDDVFSASPQLPSSTDAAISALDKRGSPYHHDMDSSPTPSRGHDSLLRSSVGPSSSPSRQDTTTSADTDAATGSIRHLSRSPDSMLSARLTGLERDDIFDQQRASTSHSMRLSRSKWHHTRDQGDSENTARQSSSDGIRWRPLQAASSAASSPLRRAGLARYAHGERGLDDSTDDKLSWAEKHPRIWRLVHGRRDDDGRSLSKHSVVTGRTRTAEASAHRRTVSHLT